MNQGLWAPLHVRSITGERYKFHPNSRPHSPRQRPDTSTRIIPGLTSTNCPTHQPLRTWQHSCPPGSWRDQQVWAPWNLLRLRLPRSNPTPGDSFSSRSGQRQPCTAGLYNPPPQLPPPFREAFDLPPSGWAASHSRSCGPSWSQVRVSLVSTGPVGSSIVSPPPPSVPSTTRTGRARHRSSGRRLSWRSSCWEYIPPSSLSFLPRSLLRGISISSWTGPFRCSGRRRALPTPRYSGSSW